MEQHIEILETLPFKEGRKAYITRKYGDMWDLPRFDHPHYRSEKSDYPWVKAERVIKKFLGKSFDKAFSYYCNQVKVYEQYEFLDNFNQHQSWGYSSHPSEYIVDDKGNIQINPEYKKRYRKRKKDTSNGVTFESYDYAEGYRHNETGEIKNNLTWCDNPRRWARIVVSGFWKHFDDVNDKEYHRLKREDRHRKELNDRRYKKWARYEKQYSFLTDEEIKLKKEEITDLIKIESHGFDENSFKGIEYHGQKRKLKNKS